MKAYWSRLSGRQKLWWVGTLSVMALLVLVGFLTESHKQAPVEHHATIASSLQELAPPLGVTGKALARELGLPLDAPKTKPLVELGVAQETLDHAVEHLLSHEATLFKYYIYAALVLFGLVFMVRLGRPDHDDAGRHRSWYPRTPYVAALVIALLVCGFVLGKSPNPMEGAVKVFKSMVGLYPSILDKLAGFAFFIALAIVGNKLICGWACPFGAFQELIYSLPVLKKLKRRKVPFWASNLVRGVLFGLVLLLLFGIVGGKKGFVAYHYVNPFNVFNWDFESWTILATVLSALLLSLFLYRPFCQFICPFGFISWIAERLSLARVRVNQDACVKCGACIRACPCHAARGLVEEATFGADCFSCARCLNPEFSISPGK